MSRNHPTGLCNWCIISESLLYPKKALGVTLVYTLVCEILNLIFMPFLKMTVHLSKMKYLDLYF